jgi:hypothetical protein
MTRIRPSCCYQRREDDIPACYAENPDRFLSQTKKMKCFRATCLSLLLLQVVDGFVRPPYVPRQHKATTRTIIRTAQPPEEDAQKDLGDYVFNENETKGREEYSNLEEDNAKRLSISKDRAISALSQPKAKDRAVSELFTTESKRQKVKKNPEKNNDSLLPPARINKNSKGTRQQDSPSSPNQRRQQLAPKESFSSLLPPPMQDQPLSTNDEDDSLKNGLSSWEDFLGGATTSKSSDSSTFLRNRNNLLPNGGRANQRSQGPPTSSSSYNKSHPSNNAFNTTDRLPSITDLFPPDLSFALNSKNPINRLNQSPSKRKFPNSLAPPPSSLDGVLPVSDLFYRSAQSMNDDDASIIERDDEELPFSAEQSDKLTSESNKIQIRRNRATAYSSASVRQSKRKGKAPMSPRKMIRRGMEMLVGGAPINADPPQRYVDLLYQHDSINWHEVISIDSKDFGPMYHTSSVSLVSRMEQALFCEHFVHSTIKWDVCPKDLKSIVKSYVARNAKADATANATTTELPLDTRSDSNEEDEAFSEQPAEQTNDEKNPSVNDPDSLVSSLLKNVDFKAVLQDTESLDGRSIGKVKSNLTNAGVSDIQTQLGGELVFSIGVPREDLESGEIGSEGCILERVLSRGLAAVTGSAGYDVKFTKLVLTDMDDGTTMISGEFTFEANDESISFPEMEQKAKRINSSLAQAMDDGDIQLAMAAAAREETSWPEKIRDRVAEEFLFEDDDGDGPMEDDEDDGNESEPSGHDDEDVFGLESIEDIDDREEESTVNSLKEPNNRIEDDHGYDGPFGMPGSAVYQKDDIFLGGGNDGVFWDYSEKNVLNAPYQGQLGLRLVDAVVERAKARHPRVIAIGDVHGCIDELQELLRQCDYGPGDLVVFLGDLVSKGPDSIAVVNMAREIGAVGVRGNHDFEVIRWHQAIKSGVDPPVVGSEHFHIASCLNKADMKWLYSLPWYISSKELGALFVHAGFVSGIRLAKQNPRLMMNMRSILPDGTVTSKFFTNWPWARLWDGPQTVLFGHDADRGLQQYEHAIGLDTGCVYGGRLTACILPERRLVSVSAKREYFKYRRKHYD